MLPHMSYPDRLKAWMEREGLTYTAAAVKIGCNVSTLVRWIQGPRTPTGLYAAKVERLLKRSETTP